MFHCYIKAVSLKVSSFFMQQTFFDRCDRRDRTDVTWTSDIEINFLLVLK